MQDNNSVNTYTADINQADISRKLLQKNVAKFGFFIFFYSLMRLAANGVVALLASKGFFSSFTPSVQYAIQLSISVFFFYCIPLIPFFLLFKFKLYKRTNRKYIGSEYSKLKSFLFYPATYTLGISTSFATVVGILTISLIFGINITPNDISYYFSDGDTDFLFKFIIVAIAAPVMEELFFRGALLGTLRPFGDRFAIFASALFFGIMHGNILQAPFATVIGLAFGYIYVRSNSLAVTIGFHILINATSTILSYLSTRAAEIILILDDADSINLSDIVFLMMFVGFFLFVMAIIITGIVSIILLIIRFISQSVKKTRISYLENDYCGYSEKKKLVVFFTNPFVIIALVLCLTYIIANTVAFIRIAG